ncbi:hypothetical protein YC2023_103685 [Brassica napus]
MAKEKEDVKEERTPRQNNKENNKLVGKKDFTVTATQTTECEESNNARGYQAICKLLKAKLSLQGSSTPRQQGDEKATRRALLATIFRVVSNSGGKTGKKTEKPLSNVCSVKRLCVTLLIIAPAYYLFVKLLGSEEISLHVLCNIFFSSRLSPAFMEEARRSPIRTADPMFSLYQRTRNAKKACNIQARVKESLSVLQDIQRQALSNPNRARASWMFLAAAEESLLHQTSRIMLGTFFTRHALKTYQRRRDPCNTIFALPKRVKSFSDLINAVKDFCFFISSGQFHGHCLASQSPWLQGFLSFALYLCATRSIR